MKVLFSTILFVLSASVYGQNVEFKSSNFKDDKDGFKAATTAIDKGDEYFELGNNAIFAVEDPGLNFELALQQYEIAQKFNPNNGHLNFKIGVCLANSSYKVDCITYIERAKELDPECDPFLSYYIGYASQLKGDFTEATKNYKAFENNYKKADEFSKFVTKRLAECQLATPLISNPIRAWVDNVKELNTEFNDFAPSISTDGGEIIYSSDRPNSHNPNEAGSYDVDIYSSSLYDGLWNKPKSVTTVNTDGDDISNNISYDGTRMLLHREVEGQTDIYESELNGLTWSIPEKMHYMISNEKADEAYAAYSPSGWSIYFSRDLPSNQRGFEIFRSAMQSKIAKDYKAAVPEKSVCSAFNDGPVYIHIDDETMYIASEGEGSIGGYDIFVSRKVRGSWQKPENLGYPINTPYDDFFFASTANGKYAYIASNRDGGSGGYDIYKVTFWGPEKKPETVMQDYLLASVVNPMKDNSIESVVDVNKKSFTVFKGVTIDALTKKPVEAKIEITDNTTGKIIETFTTNSATGKFIITLASGKNYGIAVKAEGYLFHSENFDIPNGAADNLVNKVIELKNIAVGSKIALRNIFFDVGLANLRPESNAELDRLVKLLKDVPSLEIEISGHTDNTGSAKLNEKLSQDRAQAVVDYLTGKGIAKSRMSAMGYGASKPVATNNTDAGRQENRRTEFEIKKN